jgi:hypothetical protein
VTGAGPPACVIQTAVSLLPAWGDHKTGTRLYHSEHNLRDKDSGSSDALRV